MLTRGSTFITLSGTSTCSSGIPIVSRHLFTRKYGISSVTAAIRTDGKVSITIDITTKAQTSLAVVTPYDLLNSSFVAVGGKELDLALWDVQTATQTFQAKNVPHDKLDMRLPVWIKDIAFVDSPSVCVTGTAYGQLRLYDICASRRPVWSVYTEEQRPVTCVMMAPPSKVSP